MVIREATIEDAVGAARVQVETWRTAYRGLLPDDYLDNLSYELCENEWKHRLLDENLFTYVAVEDDMVIGFANAGPERDGNPEYKGELISFYVSSDHQGKGIGRALFDRVADRFAAEGINRMLIWVLTDNKNRGFYERMGGRPLCKKMMTIGGRELEATSYGWDLSKINI